MRLIDENNTSVKSSKSSKGIFIAGGISLVILIFVIIGLLAYVTVLNSDKISLTVDSNSYRNTSQYLLNKDNVIYIGIEDLTLMLKNSGYSYKSGNRTSEDTNLCYVTNGNESTFFEVGSDIIYKVLEGSSQQVYYTLEKPIISENGKIYMPINAAKVAFNTMFSNTNNAYTIMSIGTLEGIYNKEETKTFQPDTSIVWDTDYQNKILLKDGLVVNKDSKEELGIAKVTSTTDKKTNITKVSTQSVIAPKYSSILYIEKYNYLIVEASGKKGIVKLKEENGNFIGDTVIDPQYDDITPINEDLFLVTKITKNEKDSKEIKKYGIVKRTETQKDDVIIPMIYDQIGFDMSVFPNNNLTSEYIIYDSLIPVRKGDLWGFANLKGAIVIDLAYTGIGCSSNYNSNNNVLVIPEEESIVIQKNDYYGIISKTNVVHVKTGASKIYKDIVNGKVTYTMEYDGRTYDILKYYEDVIHDVDEEKKNDKLNDDDTKDDNKNDDSNSNTKDDTKIDNEKSKDSNNANNSSTKEDTKKDSEKSENNDKNDSSSQKNSNNNRKDNNTTNTTNTNNNSNNTKDVNKN